MGNLKEIRTRISSIESTEKITSAMKLVSAAKFRRSQQAIIALRPYSNKLSEIMSSLSDAADTAEDMPLFAQRDPEKVVIIAITSNKGLCGSFNSSIIKETTRLLKEKYSRQVQAEQVQLICLGKKGKEAFISCFWIPILCKKFFGDPIHVFYRFFHLCFFFG